MHLICSLQLLCIYEWLVQAAYLLNKTLESTGSFAPETVTDNTPLCVSYKANQTNAQKVSV